MSEKEQQNEPAWKEVLSWILTFAIAIVAALLIKNYVIINASVPTGSMENTIMTGDRLIGNRLAYLKSDPQRGDIIIFKYPDNEDEIYVKRVIGLPGDVIDIVDDVVYLNGEEFDEPYLAEEMNQGETYHFEVPEDHYFMMGDNRNYSLDARYWHNPYISEDKMIAKVLFEYFPTPKLIK